MKRGFAEPQGEVWLNEGEVWKIGKTINPFKRYTQKFLTSTDAGLKFKREFSGTVQVRLQQSDVTQSVQAHTISWISMLSKNCFLSRGSPVRITTFEKADQILPTASMHGECVSQTSLSAG